MKENIQTEPVGRMSLGSKNHAAKKKMGSGCEGAPISLVGKIQKSEGGTRAESRPLADPRRSEIKYDTCRQEEGKRGTEVNGKGNSRNE